MYFWSTKCSLGVYKIIIKKKKKTLQNLTDPKHCMYVWDIYSFYLFWFLSSDLSMYLQWIF